MMYPVMLPNGYKPYSIPLELLENEPKFLPEKCLSNKRNVPLKICNDLFNLTLEYLKFRHLKLFIEYKVNILKKPLDQNEDRERLMLGDLFIMEKYNFLKVVEEVYNFSLCCKAFYLTTDRERKLIKRAATISRANPFYFVPDIILPRPTKNCPLLEPLTPPGFNTLPKAFTNYLPTPSPNTLSSQIIRDARASCDFFKKMSPIESELKISLSLRMSPIDLPLKEIKFPSFSKVDLDNFTIRLSPLTLDFNALNAEEKDKDVGGAGGA